MSDLDLITLDSFAPSIPDRSIGLYTLYAPHAKAVCQITNYGARIVAMHVLDRDGQFVKVIKGFPKLEAYQNEPQAFVGAVLGRCANKIAAGIFVLDGKTYALDTNDTQTTLHGGSKGLHAQIWNVLKVSPRMLVLQFLLKEEMDGFPGNLDVEVVYEWEDDGHFCITYHANTDKATLVNLSNHAAFNLSGEMADHELLVSASGFIEIDRRGIPSGKMLAVENTAFDFRKPLKIASCHEQVHQQLDIRNGLDHVFVLENSRPALLLHSPVSGITLAVESDRPGMYIHFSRTSNSFQMEAEDSMKDSIILSPQGFPDAIHHPYFPSIVLRPNEMFYTTTTYHFSIT
ncbi:MAG: aldose epimerase family protein [Chitinophagaceae bacterium]